MNLNSKKILRGLTNQLFNQLVLDTIEFLSFGKSMFQVPFPLVISIVALGGTTHFRLGYLDRVKQETNVAIGPMGSKIMVKVSSSTLKAIIKGYQL